jgi:hypothetical protein
MNRDKIVAGFWAILIVFLPSLAVAFLLSLLGVCMGLLVGVSYLTIKGLLELFQ